MRFLVLLVFLGYVGAERVRYDGYKVFEVVPKNQQELERLAGIQHLHDFWLKPRDVGRKGHIMVHPEKITEFESFLSDNDIKSEVIVQNVQDLIDSEEQQLNRSSSEMNWDSYQKLDTIYDWLRELPNKYAYVRGVVVGTSYQNRSIMGIEINFKKGAPGVIIESGIHAREWLAPAGTSWFINEIIQNRTSSIFRKFNYLYFPVFNPDGYEYSWVKDRLWRKTRKPYKAFFETIAYGADPNRNFDCHWESGTNPFSETYPGPNPLSEPEIASTTKYLKSVAKKKNYDIYISYHTFGDYLLYPWGWTDKSAPLQKLWDKVANEAADAWSKVNGTKVTVGQISTTLYKATGTSLDWYYSQFNSTLTFVYEMRGPSFISPPANIVIAGREHLASLKQILTEYNKLTKVKKHRLRNETTP